MSGEKREKGIELLREKEYENQSDEVLIEQLRCGQPEITDYIMEKYKNLVRKRANAMFLIGGDTDDLIQEGMIGLFKAIRDFRSDKEASFYHFADLCITRQIYNAVEASQRKKHLPLNTYISLNAQMGQEGEDTRAIQEKLKKALSGFERQVVQLYLQGLNYRQIAELLGKSPKAIDNALQRIRGKIREV